MCVITSCSVLYAATITEIETFSVDYAQLVESFQEIYTAAHDGLQSMGIRRTRRNVYYTLPRQSFIQFEPISGENSLHAPHRRRLSYYEPKICDCTIIRCPSGERGSPGSNGIPAEYGKPGIDGHPGIDGLFLVEKIVCPPCAPGPPGDDGLQGEQGEQGKPGKPGLPGQDGSSEPGGVGAHGNRGQSGRPGKKGVSGEQGEDAVQLIGVPGPKGRRGLPGISGSRGDPGLNGIPAPPRLEGPPGRSGEPGDCGDYGPRGNTGRRGPPGDDGGYCQCPSRDGSGVETGSGTQSFPSTQYSYELGNRKSIPLQVRRNGRREREQHRKRNQFRLVRPQGKEEWSLLNNSATEYREFKEGSAQKRVDQHRDQERTTTKSRDSIEFELRARF